MAQKQYQSPFGDRRIFSTPQGLRKHIDANYAKEARDTGLYDNKRWMDTLIVGGKPPARADSSTQRKTTRHRAQRGATGTGSGRSRISDKTDAKTLVKLANTRYDSLQAELTGIDTRRTQIASEMETLEAFRANYNTQQQPERHMTAGGGQAYNQQ